MKFPNRISLKRNQAFFLIFLCLTSTLFLSLTSRDTTETKKMDADWIRCSSLSLSINTYISSIGTLNLCGPGGCTEDDIVYETIVVTYYVDANKEVDLDDVTAQIMLGIQNGANLPCGHLTLHTKGSISCTTGSHNLSITLKYTGYCLN